MKEKIYTCLGTLIGIVVVIGLLYLGITWQKKKDQEFPWKASIYKIVNGTNEVRDSKDLKTLEECRNWANDQAKKLNYKEGEWDYSCGTGCDYDNNSVVSGKKVNTYKCTELTK